MVLKPVLKNWINYQPQLVQDSWTIKPYVQECMICTARAKKSTVTHQQKGWIGMNPMKTGFGVMFWNMYEPHFQHTALKIWWSFIQKTVRQGDDAESDEDAEVVNSMSLLSLHSHETEMSLLVWRVFQVSCIDGVMIWPNRTAQFADVQGIPRVSVHHTLHRQEHSRQRKRDHGCDHVGIGGVPRQNLPWNCTESTTVLEMIDDYLPGNESISHLLLQTNIIFPPFKGDMDSFPGVYPDFFLRQDDGSLPGSLPKRTGDCERVSGIDGIEWYSYQKVPE